MLRGREYTIPVSIKQTIVSIRYSSNQSLGFIFSMKTERGVSVNCALICSIKCSIKQGMKEVVQNKKRNSLKNSFVDYSQILILYEYSWKKCEFFTRQSSNSKMGLCTLKGALARIGSCTFDTIEQPEFRRKSLPFFSC